MSNINDFTKRISEFDSLSSSEKIDYIVYFLLIIERRSEAKSSEVKKCFEDLHTVPYSNIPSYLSKFSKRGKEQKFLKKGTAGYLLERKRKEEIDLITKNVPTPIPTDDLFPMVLLDNTRGYILKNAEQASVCYDIGLYDASSVMIRKLVETLIIECFERYGIESKIKSRDGYYFFLSDLIGKFLSETEWSISRNTSQSLPKIKALGDLSAHNRRFNAKKPDIDKIKDDLRIVIEDLVHLIDYPNWK